MICSHQAARSNADAPAHAGHDLLDNPHQVLIVFELHRSLVEFAGALDVDQLGSGDQDVGDGRIGKQRLQRPQSKYFVQDFADDAILLHHGQRCFLVFHQTGYRRAHF